VELKNFKSYARHYSKDPKTFEKKVAFASGQQDVLEIFDSITNPLDANLIPTEVPLIVWEDFSFESTDLNEGFNSFVFNHSQLPTYSKIEEALGNTQFFPKKITDRQLVKKMKFPIIANVGDTSEEFKTYGKFKKSNIRFESFTEKPVPTSRFEVLAFGKTPLHIEKKINQLPFDVDTSRFKHLDKVEELCQKLDSEFSPQFYKISLVEKGNSLFFESISRSGKLSPVQSVKMYEAAYADHYRAALPAWYRKSLMENHVIPYYKKRHFDALLIKPTGVIDYSKYLNQ
jgi:hypothetical protein